MSEIEGPGEVFKVDDEDIERWVGWLVQILGADVWATRRRQVHEFISGRSGTPMQLGGLATTSFVPGDAAAWHLYLCEAWITDILHYDLAQGARHIPVAKALGRSLDVVRQIDGAEERVRHSLVHEPARFDSTIFELLVATAYVRAGWSDVRFVPEAQDRKTPDIEATGSPGTIAVECKRRSRVSDYATKERTRWLQLFAPVAEFLKERRLAWVLDIVFRIPVINLDPKYLIARLRPFLPLCVPGVVIDDGELFVRIRDVDLQRAQDELRHVGIRIDGSRLLNLLFGHSDHSKGVTAIWEVQPRRDIPKVIDDVRWAAGAIWECVAPDAISAKARYMKRELADAIAQLPRRGRAAFHWGIELYDGEQVAAEIYKRTVDTLTDFERGKAKLEWVYAHMLEFSVPPDENWAVEETCHPFTFQASAGAHLLEPRRLIVPTELKDQDGYTLTSRDWQLPTPVGPDRR